MCVSNRSPDGADGSSPGTALWGLLWFTHLAGEGMQHKILGKAQDGKPEEPAPWLVLLLATIWPWQVHGLSFLSHLSSGDNTVYPIAWNRHKDQIRSVENNEMQVTIKASCKVSCFTNAPSTWQAFQKYVLHLTTIWPDIPNLNQVSWHMDWFCPSGQFRWLERNILWELLLIRSTNFSFERNLWSPCSFHSKYLNSTIFSSPI